jgi:hypothetical protein
VYHGSIVHLNHFFASIRKKYAGELKAEDNTLFIH